MKTLVHVQLGGEFGDDQPPWIPEPQELERVRASWQEALGEDFIVVATHCYENIELWDLPGDG